MVIYTTNLKHDITNAEALKQIIIALHIAVSGRTSIGYSKMIITNILKTFSEKYDFLNYVKLNRYYPEIEVDIVCIDETINYVNSSKIVKAIESIIRIVHMSINDEKAGLTFLTDITKHIDKQILDEINKFGLDLDLIQIEQHFINKQKKNLPYMSYQKYEPDELKPETYVNLLPYNWSNVGFWRYQNNICTIFDKKGKVIDRLPLDKIVKEYMVKMTGFKQLQVSSEKIIELTEKEYEFIKILHTRDVDVKTVTNLLHISKEELRIIVRKLLVNEVLQYSSFNEVILTEVGLALL